MLEGEEKRGVCDFMVPCKLGANLYVNMNRIYLKSPLCAGWQIVPHPSSYRAVEPRRGPLVRAPLSDPTPNNHSLWWYSQALRDLSSGAAGTKSLKEPPPTPA